MRMMFKCPYCKTTVKCDQFDAGLEIIKVGKQIKLFNICPDCNTKPLEEKKKLAKELKKALLKEYYGKEEMKC